LLSEQEHKSHALKVFAIIFKTYVHQGNYHLHLGGRRTADGGVKGVLAVGVSLGCELEVGGILGRELPQGEILGGALAVGPSLGMILGAEPSIGAAVEGRMPLVRGSKTASISYKTPSLATLSASTSASPLN
jgi:hypothetical protein